MNRQPTVVPVLVGKPPSATIASRLVAVQVGAAAQRGPQTLRSNVWRLQVALPVDRVEEPAGQAVQFCASPPAEYVPMAQGWQAPLLA
jgi:hypothetical protein